jgi:serine/threonine protein phosphatase PrpC
MDVQLATLTDVGRVRSNNEDSFGVAEEHGVFVVCDGMGGHNAGEVASRIACDTIIEDLKDNEKARKKFADSGKSSDAKALRKIMEGAVLAACREIHKQATKNPELSGMGTTCTAVWLVGNGKGVLGHVGDSRLYVARAGALHVLSEDHTYVNELVKRGALTKEQAKNHPQSNILSRALGVQPSVAVDTMLFDCDPGDTYLLCSDGLYNYYPELSGMAPMLLGSDIDGGLQQLVQGALDGGGHDNITGVVFRLGGEAPPVQAAVAAEQRIAILKRIPIFSHLTYHELVKVLGLTQLSRLEEGIVFINEGEMGDEFYVVLAGEVDVTKGDQVLVTLRAGAHLGEMAMIDNAPRSATVRTRTATNLLVMRREEFFNLIRTEPVIASKLLWSFVKALSGRLRETNEALQGAKNELDDQESEFEIFVDNDE